MRLFLFQEPIQGTMLHLVARPFYLIPLELI